MNSFLKSVSRVYIYGKLYVYSSPSLPDIYCQVEIWKLELEKNKKKYIKNNTLNRETKDLENIVL